MTAAVPLARIPVGVVVERRRATVAWADFVWRAVAVLPGTPAAAAWTVLDSTETRVTYFAGVTEIELYRSETEFYRDNLAAAEPAVWVVLRRTDAEPPWRLASATVDPAEGEAATQAGDDLVDVVAMPHELREALAAFVAEHHVERTFQKRRRDRADPEAMARRNARTSEKGG